MPALFLPSTNLFPVLKQPTTHWKKWSHFDLKSWVTGGNKIRPGIPSNLAQIFFNYWESRGRILAPAVTQLFRSKWLHFFLSLQLTLVGLARKKEHCNSCKGEQQQQPGICKWNAVENAVSLDWYERFWHKFFSIFFSPNLKNRSS